MAATDLTTLANLKAWLPINTATTSDDPTLSRLITAVSNDFMRATKRPDLLQATYNEVRIGDGSVRLVLYHWPIVSVTTLTVAGAPVAPSADKVAAGYFIDQDIDPERIFNLWLAGGSRFTDGKPVQISYAAGYVQPGASGPLTQGQVALPEDIEQAVIDWCACRYKERPNVSATQRRSVQGESAQTELIDAPPNVLKVIERYARAFPSLDRRQDERDMRMKSNYNFTAVSGRK